MSEMTSHAKVQQPGPNILAVREFPGFHESKVVSMKTNLARFFPCQTLTSLPSLVPICPE